MWFVSNKVASRKVACVYMCTDVRIVESLGKHIHACFLSFLFVLSFLRCRPFTARNYTYIYTYIHMIWSPTEEHHNPGVFLFPGRGSISNYMLKYLESFASKPSAHGPMVGHSNHTSFANISNCILVLSDSQLPVPWFWRGVFGHFVWNMDEYGWLMFFEHQLKGTPLKISKIWYDARWLYHKSG